MAREPEHRVRNAEPRKAKTESGDTLAQELLSLLRAIEAFPAAFPHSADRTRIALSLASGARLELEVSGRSWSAPFAGDFEHASVQRKNGAPTHLTFASIDDLGLAPSAKAAAENLLGQFPNDVKFTSGKRSVKQQAAAMAPNIVIRRKWIEVTYKATPQRTALQKWVDDNPTSTTAAQIAAGLEGVMNSWSLDSQRNFSRHITGDAFDVQPIAGAQGEKIKQAIARLPKLNWHTFEEGGLERWHAQFDA